MQEKKNQRRKKRAREQSPDARERDCRGGFDRRCPFLPPQSCSEHFRRVLFVLDIKIIIFIIY